VGSTHQSATAQASAGAKPRPSEIGNSLDSVIGMKIRPIRLPSYRECLSLRAIIRYKMEILADSSSIIMTQEDLAMRKRFPRALKPQRVGKYPAASFAGGGYVWDAVLEYRVWCCPAAGAPDEDDGNDYYFAFANYPRALEFSRRYPGADEPIALILQLEYIDEPKKGKFVHVKRRRVTEWPIEFLSRPRRNKHTIPDFFSPTAPANRIDILRGLARKSTRKRK
jgi:hypothetical protein